MANPQIENGHIKIATEIMEQLCRFRIPGEVRQVMDAVVRKTYGWNKKADIITLDQFTELTGLDKPNICRALSKLTTHNIIKTDNGQYSLQKDFDQWVPFGRVIVQSDNVVNSDNTIVQSDNNLLSKVTTEIIKSDNGLHISNQKTLTKDTTKDTISKDNGGKPPFNPLDCCYTFPDYLNAMDAYSDPIAFLVTVFKKLHSNAPDIDMQKCGGRLAGMYGKKGKDTGYILKVIWDTASNCPAGSHLDYIDAALFKNGQKSNGNGHKREPGPGGILNAADPAKFRVIYDRERLTSPDH